MRALKRFRLSSIGTISFRQVPSFYGQQQLIADEIKVWLKRELRCWWWAAASSWPTSRPGTSPFTIPDCKPASRCRQLCAGGLRGFELEQGLVVLSLSELRARRQPVRKVRRGRE